MRFVMCASSARSTVLERFEGQRGLADMERAQEAVSPVDEAAWREAQAYAAARAKARQPAAAPKGKGGLSTFESELLAAWAEE